ncbi:unnamed protein product [Amoebophrya sp. A120]|nr:unnamed protein product [Amoebophrya sp. A120]|eukprot:GSA120T00010908001.1
MNKRGGNGGQHKTTGMNTYPAASAHRGNGRSPGRMLGQPAASQFRTLNAADAHWVAQQQAATGSYNATQHNHPIYYQQHSVPSIPQASAAQPAQQQQYAGAVYNPVAPTPGYHYVDPTNPNGYYTANFNANVPSNSDWQHVTVDQYGGDWQHVPNASASCAAGASGLSPSTVANTSIVANTSLDDSWVSVSTPPAGGHQVTNTNSPVVAAAASATTSRVVTAASPVVATGNPGREYETAEAYYSYIVEQDRRRRAAQQMQNLRRTATIATEAPLSRASTLNSSRSGVSGSAAAAPVGNNEMPRVVSRPPPGLEGENVNATPDHDTVIVNSPASSMVCIPVPENLDSTAAVPATTSPSTNSPPLTTNSALTSPSLTPVTAPSPFSLETTPTTSAAIPEGTTNTTTGTSPTAGTIGTTTNDDGNVADARRPQLPVGPKSPASTTNTKSKTKPAPKSSSKGTTDASSTSATSGSPVRAPPAGAPQNNGANGANAGGPGNPKPLCYFWKIGRCEAGAACAWAHPADMEGSALSARNREALRRNRAIAAENGNPYGPIAINNIGRGAASPQKSAAGAAPAAATEQSEITTLVTSTPSTVTTTGGMTIFGYTEGGSLILFNHEVPAEAFHFYIQALLLLFAWLLSLVAVFYWSQATSSSHF